MIVLLRLQERRKPNSAAIVLEEPMTRFLSFLVVLVFMPGLVFRGDTALNGEQIKEITSKSVSEKWSCGY